MTAVRTGITFAITVALAYAACSLVFWLAPEAAAGFMNALFHGLDFRKLQAGTPFSFGGFSYALAGIAAWAFLAGMLFGWLSKRI